MWKAAVGGQVLRFRLSGINNQNFLMRDEQTGSWWQQVSGEAVQGPLRGQRLTLQPWDELSFGVWKREHPDGKVLQPEPEFQDLYADADWEAQIGELPTVTPVDPKDRLQPRDLVVGITLGGASRAYPMEDLRKQAPVLDTLGGVPLLLLVEQDGVSVRAFRREVEGKTLELFQKAGSTPPELLDAETGSVWDFSGRAVAGPLAGKSLERVQTLKDYWFDWKQYNPDSGVFSAGLVPGRPPS